ncbi:MAG: metal-binding protein [Phormidesmis priestleyi]|uniref:Metal-binding protein n=1 Tax=Phormidesmis priestleyi TaxID=268141 RepID=A0A2W4Z0R1_9CYAN|nr:MAG: metal-binding protein [Phormidesmis priestleyi]
MNRRFSKLKIFSVSLAVAGFTLTGCTAANEMSSSATENVAESQAVLASELTVYRSATCSCCGQWIEHAKAAGFTVKDEITEDMSAIKQQYGVPQSLTSCHTTVVGNYVIEGHIPAEDIKKLLAEQPNIAGIAVPGMPVGSPGMESGDYSEPYTVFSFTKSGETATFAEHS